MLLRARKLLTSPGTRRHFRQSSLPAAGCLRETPDQAQAHSGSDVTRQLLIGLSPLLEVKSPADTMLVPSTTAAIQWNSAFRGSALFSPIQPHPTPTVRALRPSLQLPSTPSTWSASESRRIAATSFNMDGPVPQGQAAHLGSVVSVGTQGRVRSEASGADFTPSGADGAESPKPQKKRGRPPKADKEPREGTFGASGGAEERCGSIHIIVGPMFSGKTTELLRRVMLERELGRNVLLVKSHVDTRYADEEVVSHSGARMRCLAVRSMADILPQLGPAAYQEVDIIAVDEAQFIQDLELFAAKEADYSRKTIILAGLDGDFMRRKFGALVDLIPVAESVTKLQARCQICGNGASFTLRKSADLRKELIGGADVYMPVCREHYLAAKQLVDTVGDVDGAQKASVHVKVPKVKA